MQVARFFVRVFNFTVLVLTLCVTAEAQGPRFRVYETPRFTLHVGLDAQPSAPVSLDTVLNTALSSLNDTYEELTAAMNVQPRKKVVLRLLTPAEFRAETGAPEWTSAMYFRDEISIPVTANVNLEELRRAVRHEYVHAVVAEISEHRCPAWLDEGLAQIVEGDVNPLLGPALRAWISGNDSMPLAWLQNGFTTLDSEVVPAAYAESLFATRLLLKRAGFKGVMKFITAMRVGTSHDVAFKRAFGQKQTDFERELTMRIAYWAASDEPQP